ncbi:subtilisin-like protein [Lactarius psammicola]|nr:subtilisin-like protein [Lactarius psammicola]
MLTKHSWKAVPKNWESPGRTPSGTTIDLYIALKPHRENALIDALYEIRAHLSKEQVVELVAPHPKTLKLVNFWLGHHDVPSSPVSMTHSGNTLMLKGVHAETGETIVRTVGYALPAALHGHVLTVMPTMSFVSPPAQLQTPRNRSGGAAARLVASASGEPTTMLLSRFSVKYIAPSFLRWLYDTSTYTPTARDRKLLGIVGYLRHYPNLTDLTAFMRKYRSDEANATFTIEQANGGGTARATKGEHGHPSGKNIDWFVSWLKYTLNQPSPPQTICTSYTLNEGGLSREDATCVCDLFAQLVVRGVSVLFSSGTMALAMGGPWVTVVGGTTGSGPEYQQQAVSIFLQDLSSRYQGFYNATGRGTPDIAARAIGFRIVVNGNEMRGTRTRGARPVVAGIISLLNDWLLSRGQDPLGFLKPWLYESGFIALDDLTVGSNPGCNTDGFSAIAGWDPVRFTRLVTSSLFDVGRPWAPYVTSLGTSNLDPMQGLY